MASQCAAPTCTDGIKNGTEIDADCGGSVCGVCFPGAICMVGTDCSSGACSVTCEPPGCVN